MKWVLTLLTKILKKNKDKPKRKRNEQNEKIKKREEKKKNLESDLEVNTEKLNNIKTQKNTL